MLHNLLASKCVAGKKKCVAGLALSSLGISSGGLLLFTFVNTFLLLAFFAGKIISQIHGFAGQTENAIFCSLGEVLSRLHRRLLVSIPASTHLLLISDSKGERRQGREEGDWGGPACPGSSSRDSAKSCSVFVMAELFPPHLIC